MLIPVIETQDKSKIFILFCLHLPFLEINLEFRKPATQEEFC